MDPPEVLVDVLQGKVAGTWYAAQRKLLHELGISLPLDNPDWQRHYVRRVRYWAADTVTHGSEAPWGEHETDYLLLVTVPNKAVVDSQLKANPDEVQATRWVSMDELQAMFRDSSLLFSPWFRIIANAWLMPSWWKNLEMAMQGEYDDYATIAAFDPPLEHLGGAGKAERMFASSKSTVVSEVTPKTNGVVDDSIR
jgi:isopentenyldiphosphate isomerase